MTMQKPSAGRKGAKGEQVKIDSCFEQLSLFDKEPPKMPESYKGEEIKGGRYVKSNPRKWTDKEIEFALDLKSKGYKTDEIAESLGRDIVATSIKLKRLGKQGDTYNKTHLKAKYAYNDNFYEVVKPQSVLDVYAGQKHYWKTKCECVSNDIDPQIEADYHMDSLKFMCAEYLKGNKYDLIDLDPFGSAFDCFDLALKMAKKGLIVTYGELGHKRWKRLDYVRSIYNIDRLEDFTIENLIIKTQEIAAHNKKRLAVYSIGEWQNIARVYYLIEPLKITEQWEENA